MDFGNGWRLTPDQWCRLHVLDSIYDLACGQPKITSYIAVDAQRLVIGLPLPPTEKPPALFEDAFRNLRVAGLLVTPVPKRGPIPGIPARTALTRAGVEEVKAIRRRRTDQAIRRPAARDALLRWVYDQHATGQSSVLLCNFGLCGYARFLTTRAEFFSRSELEAASHWLADHEYLACVPGTTDLHLTITKKGEWLVESGRSTNDDQELAHSTSISVSGSTGVNIVNSSSRVTQTTTITMTTEGREALRSLADRLEQVAKHPDVQATGFAHVPELAVELRTAAAEPAVNEAKLRRILHSVREIAGQLAIGGLAAGPVAVEMTSLLNQLLHILGLG